MNDILNFIFFDEFANYNLQTNYRRPRKIKPRINYIEILDEVDFKNRFRISKNSFMILLERIENQIRQNTDCNDAIPPIIQLLVALRFYATGSYLQIIGDFCGISISSTQRIVYRVSCAIATLRQEFIKLPLLPEEIRQNEEEFYQTAKFIRAIGCMDCTHIKIQSYGKKESELYRNRKGWFSFNVQVVVNAKLEIIDIVARWPGSTHDSTIFNHSRIKSLFEAGTFGDSVLIADSGYPNLSYIMCPLQSPTTAAEHLYNEAQIRTRSKIERFFGIWKRTFPILSVGTRFRTPEKMLPVIVATAVLHNIIQHDKEEIIVNPEAYNNAIVLMQNINESNRNVTDVRRTMVEYFERLIF